MADLPETIWSPALKAQLDETFALFCRLLSIPLTPSAPAERTTPSSAQGDSTLQRGKSAISESLQTEADECRQRSASPPDQPETPKH